MNCPRCHNPLTTKTLMDFKYFVHVDSCTSCEGAWFDNGELTRLEKTIEPTFIEVRKIPSKHDQFEVLHCPACDDHPVLQKAEHTRDKKVIIDYCTVCKGIWLDKGEIEAIRTENWLITIGRVFRWLVSSD